MSVAPIQQAATSPHRGLVEVSTLAFLYGIYELVRGQGHATLAAARAHTDLIVDLERSLHIFGERAVQNAAHAVPGASTVLGIAYIVLHFIGTAAFLVWLYRRHRERFALVRNVLIGATGIALAFYVLFPVAPPRLAGLGFVDTVSESAKVNLSSDLLGSLYNPFAAVPSLHFGYALLVGLTLASLGHRVIGWSYPVVMLIVVVGTGNHFFFDAFAGALAIGAGFAIARIIAVASTREPRSRAAAGRAVLTS
ncbi:MAG: phosphatase PAP2 family protein [Gaiellaceae bacterium]